MSLILAAPKNVKVDFQAFIEKGHHNLMPCEASDVVVSAFPIGDEDMGRMGRLSFIHAYIKSQKEGRLVSIATAGFNGHLLRVEGIPIDIPVANFICGAVETKERAVALGMVDTPGRKNVVEGKISWSELKDLMSLGISDTNFKPGQVSMTGAIAFHLLAKIATAVTCISAAKTGQGKSVVLYGGNQNLTLDGSANKISYLSEKGKTFESMETISFAGSSNAFQATSSMVASPLNSSGIIKAPYDWDPKKMLRSSTTVPTYYAQYFRDIMIADKYFVPNVVQRLFIRSLGDTPENAAQNFNIIRSGWRSLCHTRQGEELSHLFMGISLAEQSGCTIVPCLQGSIYRGFILQGDVEVFFRGKLVEPKGEIEALAFINSYNLHDQRLAEIASMFEQCKNLDGSTKYPCTVEVIRTSRRLQDFYHSIDISDYDAKWVDTVMKKVDDLSFSDRYADFNEASLKKFVEFVQTGSPDVIREFHRYIRVGALRKRSRVAIGLSIFGPRVPSISYGTGNKVHTYQIPKAEDAIDTNFKKGNDGKPALHYIPVGQVNFDVGVAQWTRFLETGKLIIFEGRQGKKEFTDSTLVKFQIGGTSLEPFYKDLKSIIRDNQDAKGKRKADDIPVAGGSKKQRKGKGADGSKNLLGGF